MNQMESFHCFTSSHGLWKKTNSTWLTRYSLVLTFLCFRCTSNAPHDLETQTSSLYLKLVIQLSASGLLYLLPVFCLECISQWKASSYFTLGFPLRGQYYTGLPWLLYLRSLSLWPVSLYPRAIIIVSCIVSKAWNIWVYFFVWVLNLLIPGPWGQRFFYHSTIPQCSPHIVGPRKDSFEQMHNILSSYGKSSGGNELYHSTSENRFILKIIFL